MIRATFIHADGKGRTEDGRRDASRRREEHGRKIGPESASSKRQARGFRPSTLDRVTRSRVREAGEPRRPHRSGAGAGSGTTCGR